MFATQKHVRNETCVQVCSHCCGHFTKLISRVSRFQPFRPRNGKITKLKGFSHKKYIRLATDNSQDSCKHVSRQSHGKKLCCPRITYKHFAVRPILSWHIFLRENPVDFVILPLLIWNSLKHEVREMCLMKWPQQYK